jgi:dTDP-4-dehydrorhamnose 3,5-epimerase
VSNSASNLVATPTPLAGVFVLQPKVFGDARGFFFESYNERAFGAALGLNERSAPRFVQDNHSRSSKGILRGLHYQIQQPQAKLVRVTQGAAYDVVVDLRKSSPTFGKSFGVRLSAQEHNQLYVPIGFAHGFLALADQVDFLYKTTDFYAPQHERALLWNDPSLGINWPLEESGAPQLNARDANGFKLTDVDCFA